MKKKQEYVDVEVFDIKSANLVGWSYAEFSCKESFEEFLAYVVEFNIAPAVFEDKEFVYLLFFDRNFYVFYKKNEER